MDNAVSLTSLGILGTAIAGLIWLAKFVAKTLGQDLKEHTKAAIASTQASNELKKSVDRSYQVSTELHTFMKKLNGKLENAVIQRVQEQHVDTQVVVGKRRI